MGYAGGTASLILALFIFIQQEELWTGLNKSQAEHIRATFLLVAVWYLIFSLPMLFFTPDTVKRRHGIRQAIKKGIRELRKTLADIVSHRLILRFLIARMFYVDGLTTLFTFGGIYAATTFNMKAHDILLFGIALNIVSGIGAVCFAWVDDRIGSQFLILFSLAGLIIPTMLLLFISNPHLFWALGLFLGIFVGPVQSASRSFMARLAPPIYVTKCLAFLLYRESSQLSLDPF